MTFGTPSFQDITPFGQTLYETRWKAPLSETKKGTVMVIDTSTTGYLKVIDSTIGAATAARLDRGVPGILMQDVKDLDAGAIVGYRKRVSSERNYGDVVAIAQRPGMKFKIGAQDSTDEQAGYTEDVTLGDRLYTSVDSSGVLNGGISKTGKTTVSTVDYFGIVLGQADVSATYASGDVLEWIFAPQIIHDNQALA